MKSPTPCGTFNDSMIAHFTFLRALVHALQIPRTIHGLCNCREGNYILHCFCTMMRRSASSFSVRKVGATDPLSSFPHMWPLQGSFLYFSKSIKPLTPLPPITPSSSRAFSLLASCRVHKSDPLRASVSALREDVLVDLFSLSLSRPGPEPACSLKKRSQERRSRTMVRNSISWCDGGGSTPPPWSPGTSPL